MFKYLQHMHLIGVDHLYPKIGTPDEPDQHVALKVGSSAAHHFGSTRLLCESMGGTYWDCTLERMKWMNNWEYVLGVNLFNNHGYHYTIEGERKRDWPPSQFYHHTWWKYYDWFTDYNARLSHILSGGSHVAKVLMLYPINSIWTNYMPQKRTAIGNVIESEFQYLTDTLLRLHYDFDYVDEDVLADAEIIDGEIRIRDESYSVFILPPVTHIKGSTLEKLTAFVDAGGSVIGDTLLPMGLLDAGSGDGALPVLPEFFGMDSRRINAAFVSGEAGDLEVVKPDDDKNFFFLKGPGLAETRPGAMLQKLLNQCVDPDVTIDDEEIFYLHRVKDGFDIYFLVNTTRSHKESVRVTFEQVGRPELWNATSGDTQAASVYEVDKNRTSLLLDFPPSESHVVVFDGSADRRWVSASNLKDVTLHEDRVTGYGSGVKEPYAAVIENGESIRLSGVARPDYDPVVFPSQMAFEVEPDNILAIEHWRMRMASEIAPREGIHEPDFDDTDWLNVTNGAWEMQLLEERDDQTYPEDVWYRTSFQIRDIPSRLALLIDGFSGSHYQLYINATEITERGERSWLDAEIRSVDILPHIKEGTNSVAVKLTVTRRTDGMLDLLKLVGDFTLIEEDGEWGIAAKRHAVEIGDWTQQGLPFFSGTGIYRTTVDVPEEFFDGGRIYLEAECGEDVLEVIVNGNDPLILPWHPYRADITDLLDKGQNDFELRVTNTLVNILEAQPKESGLFSPPRLVHVHRYELTEPNL
jgi:hypothetical protein